MMSERFKTILLAFAFFASLAPVKAQKSLSFGSKDNFSLYLLGVQSELLGDNESAVKFFKMSSYSDDSVPYYPSILKNISLRLDNGDYGDETAELIESASSFPDTALTNYMKIDLLMGRKEYSKAAELCNSIIAADPDNDRIYHVLSLIDYSEGKLDSALSRINLYESVFGIDYQLYSVKREILVRKDLYDSLLSYNERISELYPESLEILADLANVYTAVGKDSSAYSLWNSILSEEPNSLEFLLQSNQFYASRGYRDEAISTSGVLLSSPYIRPDAKEQLFRNIFMAVDINKDSVYFPKIDSVIIAAASAERDTTVVQELALSFLYYTRNYGSAFEVLDTMISRNPSVRRFPLQKASLLNTLNRTDEAYALLDTYSSEYPDVADYNIYHAELIKDSQSEKEAVSFINKAIKSCQQDTTKAEYYTYLADLSFKKGKSSESFRLYEKSLSLRPDHPMTLNNYAYFLACSGKSLEKALVMSHKCNSLVSPNPTYLDTEAYILYRLGLFQEAKEKMDLAFSLDTQEYSSELYMHYADILASLGNNILARKYYEKALEAGADEEVVSKKIESLGR